MLFLASTALAHAPGSSHLLIDLRDAQQQRLRSDLAIVDLAQVLPIDNNVDGEVSWGEVLESRAEIAAYVRANLRLGRGSVDCVLNAELPDTAIINYSGVAHVSMPFILDCPGSDTLTLDYGLFFAIDPGHRGIARILDNRERLLVLSAARPTASIGADDDIGFSGMIREGIHHILIGYDHLLFLLMLILPAVSTTRFKQRAWRLAGIVTAFTVAHTITLALATSGVLTLPTKPVEIAIAASIAVAATVNIVQPGHRIGWQLAFGFGLLHGFGFAGALAELGLSSATLFRNLLAFNVGVEIGQLMVVAVTLPLLLLLARWPRYRRVLVPALSAAGAAVGLLWTAGRL